MTPDTPVQWHERIDSTNEEARRLAKAGMYGPLWIAAREQSAGRGRLGRQWTSPQGNLYCTALFLEPEGIQLATRYPFAAGLAIVDALKPLLPNADLVLKWPNDVRCDGAKLAGILVEAGAAEGRAVWIAAGMGLNVGTAPEGTGQAATSVRELGGAAGLTADLVLEPLRPALSARIAQAREDFPALLKDWEGVAEGLGSLIRVGKDDEAVEGMFRGLQPDGGLRLELRDGSTRTIRTGDVELVREIGKHAARD